MEWATERKNPKGIENLSLEDLEEALGVFHTELKYLKKKDGRNCEPESLGVYGRLLSESLTQLEKPLAGRQVNTSKRTRFTYLLLWLKFFKTISLLLSVRRDFASCFARFDRVKSDSVGNLSLLKAKQEVRFSHISLFR